MREAVSAGADCYIGSWRQSLPCLRRWWWLTNWVEVSSPPSSTRNWHICWMHTVVTWCRYWSNDGYYSGMVFLLNSLCPLYLRLLRTRNRITLWTMKQRVSQSSFTFCTMGNGVSAWVCIVVVYQGELDDRPFHSSFPSHIRVVCISLHLYRPSNYQSVLLWRCLIEHRDIKKE